MIYAVFSLGQFVSSNLDVLKKEFSDWFKKSSVEKTGDDVWNWLQSSGHLKSLRLGKMTVSQLCESFNKEFKLTMSFTDFSNMFNSMCKVDSEALKRIKGFKDFLDQHENIQLILVSHTNYSHLHYILSQVGPTLGKDGFSVIQKEEAWNSKAKIVFAPSMSSQCEQHPDTLKFALGELKASKDDTLISFLNSVQAYTHDHFSYVDPGKTLEKAPGVLEDALKNLQKGLTL
ncbi:hypothetical protein [Legionella waltersii]|uniref:Uncharacterized protein n=1 Tax=Legionella waltersii TaxID=66969 RepID=A0A0W0ZZV6_9GAMM|nr:hypothetical protein [Legionella waltersii]KTD74612.1 hypothetical protein Lwal_2653 [Legionella waltersii]SNV08801.1 Uncharacterised protein [Legionella waltersii]